MEKKAKSIERAIKNLSLSFHKANYSSVIEISEMLLENYPMDFRLWNFLGLSYTELQNLKKAIIVFKSGIEQCPKKTILLNNLSLVYIRRGMYKEAQKCLGKSINLDPKQFQPSFLLGNLFYKLNEYEKSELNYLKALKFKTDHFHLNLNISILYKEMGYIEKSIRFCEEALKNENSKAIAHRHMTSIKKYTDPKDEHIQKMRDISRKGNIPLSEKSDISFALAKALEDCLEYEEAFKFLKSANEFHRSEIDYSHKEQVKIFTKIKKLFSSYEDNSINETNQFSKHIFILGMPRSGTSLIEQILSSHSNVQGGGELKHLLTSVKESFSDQGYIFPTKMNAYNQSHQKRISCLYQELTKPLFGGKEYLVDKMPFNFLLIGFIRTALPGAKIILVRRNPLENCFSIYKQKFKSGNKFAYDLQETAQYYNSYQSLINFWKSKFKNPFFEMRYEDLVSNIEERTADLLKFCDLEWEDACLNFHENKRVVKTASAAQVRLPIYDTSISVTNNYSKELEKLSLMLSFED